MAPWVPDVHEPLTFFCVRDASTDVRPELAAAADTLQLVAMYQLKRVDTLPMQFAFDLDDSLTCHLGLELEVLAWPGCHRSLILGHRTRCCAAQDTLCSPWATSSLFHFPFSTS